MDSDACNFDQISKVLSKICTNWFIKYGIFKMNNWVVCSLLEIHYLCPQTAQANLQNKYCTVDSLSVLEPTFIINYKIETKASAECLVTFNYTKYGGKCP